MLCNQEGWETEGRLGYFLEEGRANTGTRESLMDRVQSIATILWFRADRQWARMVFTDASSPTELICTGEIPTHSQGCLVQVSSEGVFHSLHRMWGACQASTMIICVGSGLPRS